MTPSYKKLGLFILTAVLLNACTAIHTPPVSLPDRSSITPGETVTVSGRENIYGLAKAHNVSMREIIVLNNLQAPYVLKSGQQIVLPGGSGSGSYSSFASPGPAGQAPLPSAAPSGSIEAVPLEPIQSAPVQSVPLAPVAPNATIQKQGVLTAPIAKPTAVDALNAPNTPKPVATTIAPNQQIAAATPPVTPPTPLTTPPAPALSTATPPTSIAMVWPVKGPILSAFGPKGQGLNNDGINIGAPKGAPVVAASAGTVVYAGSEMKGFGNLVLIRHEGGWVTAYAHLDRMLVSKDAVVGQGDMIGTVGKTGNVPSPQLHFETRYEGKSVDPSGVIKS